MTEGLMSKLKIGLIVPVSGFLVKSVVFFISGF